jgi:hypothetical protein
VVGHASIWAPDYQPMPLGRNIHRIEPMFLFIAQRVIKPRKRTVDNLYGLDGRTQSLLDGVEATYRSERH